MILAGLYACTGNPAKKSMLQGPQYPGDSTSTQLKNVRQYNSIVFKNKAITHCSTTRPNCLSDLEFITDALKLINPTYKTTQLEATIYQGTALFNNAGHDSTRITCYRIKTENMAALQQLITRLDTAGQGYVRKMAKTEAPITCYFTTTPSQILLITHIGIPELQKLKNQPLVTAVKEQIGSR
ncbi:hypothetical protein [Niabella drilacis]|uniref:Uncharacterized protein n=1 Tax=Niabella drilacis (strain DSM 25811 / CCM 8410 / CCUG 62505 / LMG 26954 / E90) TaxID=1285928 RepID=A0A1G6LDN3_NIADE|nr:hypothetical protein [Niabella drilacis]SDC41303.1 hypothetical protein SAMN04487894_102312 [Niabella drilacis]